MWPFSNKKKKLVNKYSTLLEQDDDSVKVDCLKQIIKDKDIYFNNFSLLQELALDVNLEVSYWSKLVLVYLKPSSKKYLDSLILLIESENLKIDRILSEILLKSKLLFFKRILFFCKKSVVTKIDRYKPLFYESKLNLSKILCSLLNLKKTNITKFVLILITEKSNTYLNLHSFLLKFNNSNLDNVEKSLTSLSLFKIKPKYTSHTDSNTIIELLRSRDAQVISNILDSILIMGSKAIIFQDELLKLNFSNNFELQNKLKLIIKEIFFQKQELFLSLYESFKDKKIPEEIFQENPKDFLTYLIREDRNLYFNDVSTSENLLKKIINKKFSLLNQFLNEPNDLIQLYCLNSIEEDTELTEENKNWLFNHFTSSNPNIVSLSIDKAVLLNIIDESHFDFIYNNLSHSDPRVKLSSINSIKCFSSENQKKTSSILTHLLNDDFDDIRVNSGKILLEIGMYSEKMLELISRSISNTSLSNNSTSEKLLVILAKGLKDPNAKKRLGTIEKIMETGFKSFSIINEVEPCLFDSDIWVRAKACNYFESLNEFSKPFISKIYSLFQDKDWYVRQSAIKAIRKIQDLQEIDVNLFYNIATSDNNKHVRKEAVSTLVKTKKQKNSNLDSIFLEILKDDDENIRELASLGLSGN